MSSMDIGVELMMSDEAAGEVVLGVDFKYRAGAAAHLGSLSYPGHPADPPEIEIETIFWPIEKWDAGKKVFVPDHIVMPPSGLPTSVLEAVEAHICEHYIESDDED